LAKNDDQTGSDPALDWKASQDGDSEIVLRDLRRFGGPDFRYRLSLEEALPSVEAFLDSHAFAMDGGKDLLIPVKLRRNHGHARPVTLTIHGLPASCDAQALTIPAGQDESSLRIGTPRGVEDSATHLVTLRADDGNVQRNAVYLVSGATTPREDLARCRLTSFLVAVQPISKE
jgi:hypothetical protein